ncbi:MAG: sensor domain-containing protein [Mycobacterium sp.]
MRMTRWAVPLAAIILALSGCTNVVAGTAQPGDAGGPDGPTPGDLAATLLSVEEINSIMGADDLEVVESSEELVDHSADISDPACLGALYNAEQVVYDNSGWTELVDEILTQPVDDPANWIEQTAVRFPSVDDASAFYESSKAQWQECISQQVSVFDGEYEYTWEFDGLTVSDTTISQSALQLDSDGWTCQHAMSAAADVVIEASACSMSPDEEAVTIVEALAKNVG